jgi:exodeoxyribonuclease-3
VCCYTPNAQNELKRIGPRLAWGAAFTRFVANVSADKPVVICGDLNVAHHEIDLKNPGPNRGNAGFSDEERADFQALLNAGFTDSFRFLHPDATGAYSWWSFRANARANNTGWRIDYFLVSDNLQGRIEQASIYPEVMGSDHCPVGLILR